MADSKQNQGAWQTLDQGAWQSSSAAVGWTHTIAGVVAPTSIAGQNTTDITTVKGVA